MTEPDTTTAAYQLGRERFRKLTHPESSTRLMIWDEIPEEDRQKFQLWTREMRASYMNGFNRAREQYMRSHEFLSQYYQAGWRWFEGMTKFEKRVYPELKFSDGVPEEDWFAFGCLRNWTAEMIREYQRGFNEARKKYHEQKGEENAN